MPVRRLTSLVSIALVLSFTGNLSAAANPAESFDRPTAEADIKLVLATQEAAWNRGDIPGFMQGYAQTPDLRFASGGSVTYGWQETLARYQRGYDTPAKMGQLAFNIIALDILSPDAAVAFGRWELNRTDDAPKPNGLFTLIFRKTADGWRITADHTSSADR